MKKVFSFSAALCFIVGLLFAYPVFAFADNRNETVYVTDTGTKYHVFSCGYLNNSCNEISLWDAANAGYTACSRCKPPLPDFAVLATPKPTHSSGNSTSHSSITASQVVVYTPQPKITPNKETSVKEEPTVFQSVCFYVLICVSIALYTALRWERKSNQAEEEKLRSQIKTERLKTRNILDNLYSGKDLLKISGAPEKCWIGSDGRPCSAGDGRWGVSYTFYINPYGHAYHKKECRFSGPSMINAKDLRGKKDYSPCAVCKPVLPDLEWLDEYQRIDRLMREYGLS